MTTGKVTQEKFRHGLGVLRTDIWKGRPKYRSSGVPIDWAVVALGTLAILAIGLVSPELLTALGIHYVRPGGSFYEKLHPATYLVLGTFVLLLMRSGDPIGEFDRIMSNTKLLFVHFFACGLLVFQCLVMSRPFTSVIDTFLLPVMLSLIVWSLTPAQRKPMVVAVHVAIWINIALGFYEYFSKHRLVPMWIGNIVITGDWRSTALLGHPLSAAAVVAMYIIALALVPKAQTRSPLLGIPALAVATCSLMVFGGRIALAAVLLVYAGLVVGAAFRLVRGERFGLAAVIIVACGIMLVGAAITIALGTGAFDNMLERFSSDKGSAYARITTMHFLSLFDWNELLLGPIPSHTAALQSMMGLQAGIETSGSQASFNMA